MNINCEIARDLLPLYKDRCLSASSEEALRSHLSDCSELFRACEKAASAPHGDRVCGRSVFRASFGVRLIQDDREEVLINIRKALDTAGFTPCFR